MREREIPQTAHGLDMAKTPEGFPRSMRARAKQGWVRSLDPTSSGSISLKQSPQHHCSHSYRSGRSKPSAPARYSQLYRQQSHLELLKSSTCWVFLFQHF